MALGAPRPRPAAAQSRSSPAPGSKSGASFVGDGALPRSTVAAAARKRGALRPRPSASGMALFERNSL
eukprot:1033433-Pyramimonas_sp.AAC.1